MLLRPTYRTKLFFAPQRCIVPPTGDKVSCSPLFDSELYFDYPTFNPLFKMNASFQFFYGIAPKQANPASSRWFQSVLKFGSKTRTVLAEWSADDVYVTEPSFIPRRTHGGAEDDGVLFTVAFNATADQSSVVLLDAATLELVEMFPLPEVIPFHAHGIHSRYTPGHADSKVWYPNP